MSFPYINAYQQFLDSSGDPLVSGTIEFRDPTSNSLINSYPTADDADAQTNANDNPLTLNASGAASSGLYLEDGVAYKVILKDANGDTVKTDDDVLCPIALPYLQTAAESAASVTPTNVEYPPGDVRRYGAVGDGVTDDTSAFNSLMDVLAQSTPSTVTIPGNLNYLITATVDCDFTADTTIIAYGAKFTHNANGVLFDINPVATAAIPITSTVDTWTKRRVKWFGGQFYNTNATKTASVAIQAYFMRHFVCEPEYVEAFFCGVKFAGKDSYHFANSFFYDCERSYWVPDAGVVFTASLTGNDLLIVSFDNCHHSITGKPYGVFIENRIQGLSFNNCSYNGEATTAHVSISDNETLYCEGITFNNCHFEAMTASLPAVTFDATGVKGFYTTSFIGCTFNSGTAGWYGVVLNKCLGVYFYSNSFRDGSGGSTEQAIYVDDGCRDIEISDSNGFLSVAAGQAVVLETATNRQHVTLQPVVVKSETPDILTSYNPSAESDGATTIDMSAEFADFANFLLPPKGYFVTLTARDSGSSAASTDTCEAKLGKPSGASGSEVVVWLAGVNNDFRRSSSGYVPADENGDITLTSDATGASTLDVWIGITGVTQ